MKTKENNSENRKQNNRRAVLKITAMLVYFVVISLTVNAQDNWEHHSNSNNFEIFAMLESNHVSGVSVSSYAVGNMAFYLKPATEEALELESWMTDDEYFNAFSFLLETATEDKLELEEWMLSERYFTIRCEVEYEEELKLENWMMDAKIWR
jgi:hypothetical protein